jgi:hypothetical protein
VKPIRFSAHAREQMALRGIEEGEVIVAVIEGALEPAKRGRQGYRTDFQYDRLWQGRHYGTKQVLAIVAEEPEELVVVTVYAFYF